jgi:hypothetical protein
VAALVACPLAWAVGFALVGAWIVLGGNRQMMKALRGRASALPFSEQALILDAARTAGVDPAFLAAIRVSENGAPGREFGVLSVPAPTIADQARVAAASIAANLDRYRQQLGRSPYGLGGQYTSDFINFMAARYAPVGARNDARGLNSNWSRNVAAVYYASWTA